MCRTVYIYSISITCCSLTLRKLRRSTQAASPAPTSAAETRDLRGSLKLETDDTSHCNPQRLTQIQNITAYNPTTHIHEAFPLVSECREQTST